MHARDELADVLTQYPDELRCVLGLHSALFLYEVDVRFDLYV
jgi:hypothetical protein